MEFACKNETSSNSARARDDGTGDDERTGIAEQTSRRCCYQAKDGGRLELADRIQERQCQRVPPFLPTVAASRLFARDGLYKTRRRLILFCFGGASL